MSAAHRDCCEVKTSPLIEIMSAESFLLLADKLRELTDRSFDVANQHKQLSY